MYLCQLLNIDHRFTAPYNYHEHPATTCTCNGKVERFNRFVKKAVAIIVEERGNGWTLYIHAVVFAYRTRHAVHATGMTPFEALYGRPGRLPLDMLTTATEELKLNAGRMHANHLTRLAATWQRIRDLQAEHSVEFESMADDAGNHRLFHEGDYC
jgi:hypothetical protein